MNSRLIIPTLGILAFLVWAATAQNNPPTAAPAAANPSPAATAPTTPAPNAPALPGLPERPARVTARPAPATPSTNAPAASPLGTAAAPGTRPSLFPPVPGQTTATPANTNQPVVIRPGTAVAGSVPGAAGADDGTDPALEPGTVQIRPRSGSRLNMEDLMKGFSWSGAPIDQVLDYYAQLTGRTVLRPSSLTGTVTIKTHNDLTRREAIEALDSVLALNGITMINRGERFVKAVQQQQAGQEAAAFSNVNEKDLPEAEQYTTQIVQLKNAKPSEVVQALTPFAKNPTGIVGIDSSQIIVLRDYAANVKRMLEVLKRIDVVPEMDYQLEVIPIKYGKVEDIYNTMSSLIGGGGGAVGSSTRSTRSTATTGGRGGAAFGTAALQQQRTALQPNQPVAQPNQSSFQDRLNRLVNRASGGNEAQLLTDAKIIPDERSNSLIVFANKQDLKMITNIVAKVDVALAQVMIEAIVLEVTLGDNRNMGVSYLQRPQSSGQFSGAGGVNNGQTFINPKSFLTAATSNAPSGPAGIGALPSGFSYFGVFGNEFDVAVTAIAGDSTVNVMSRPRIVTSHAVPGSFFVGDTVPYITGTSYGYGGFGDSFGGNRSTYTQLSVGIQLDVTPFITPDGLVVMELQQNIEQLGTTVKIDNNDVPTTVRRTANATISVRDRDTIMLGGFINSNKTKSSSGVPGLMRVPVLGNLFKSKSDNNKRVELIVLMRPLVLQSPKDAAVLAREELEKLPGVRRAQVDWEKEEQTRTDKANKEIKDKRSKNKQSGNVPKDLLFDQPAPKSPAELPPPAPETKPPAAPESTKP